MHLSAKEGTLRAISVRVRSRFRNNLNLLPTSVTDPAYLEVTRSILSFGYVKTQAQERLLQWE